MSGRDGAPSTITAQQIQNAGGLDAYLSSIKKFSFSVPSRTFPSRSQQQMLGAPPEPGLPGFAHTYSFGSGSNYTSGVATLALFTQSIPSSDLTDHSLVQTWTTTGANNSTPASPGRPAVPCTSNCQQTVEAGSVVEPALFGDTNPHLFVYSTPDGYWTGCWNGSIPGNNSGSTACPSWVGLPSSYPPGVTLPSTVSGNRQQIFVWVGRCSFYNECQNGWEVRVSVDLDGEHYVPVGYYPDSNFGSAFSVAARFVAGGEVYQASAVPSDTLFTLPMGSGSVASAGLGRAAYVANLSWTGTSGAGNFFGNGGFGAPFSTVPAKYGVWQNPNPGLDEIDLGVDFYLGAPVPPPPPPPPPPTCTPQQASSSDQFFGNSNNIPVQVDAGGTGTVNLILDGPWIAPDHGNNAIGQITFDNLPTGSIPRTLPAEADNSGHSYALMEFLVTVPPLAKPGSYIATVKATDAATCVSLTTTVPIQILPCVPQSVCPTGGVKSCGAISNGCGGTINCGVCALGLHCSNSYCCPAGTSYNPYLNGCASSSSWPPSCPSGTSYCDALAVCTTTAICNRQVYCQKVGALKECQ